MNFEFFAFLVFMSFVSFAVAFLAYGMVVRFMGKDGFLARVGQIILVPACIVIYDFITMAARTEKVQQEICPHPRKKKKSRPRVIQAGFFALKQNI